MSLVEAVKLFSDTQTAEKSRFVGGRKRLNAVRCGRPPARLSVVGASQQSVRFKTQPAGATDAESLLGFVAITDETDTHF